MPALVNVHVHVGYDRNGALAADNYTRANILEQLDRYSYAGVGVVTTLGTDAGDIVFGIRAQQEVGLIGGALLLSAARGLARPDAGPANAAMRPSAVGVSTEAEARAAVREQAGKNPPLIKIWVDDRNGTVEKLPPALYRAIIEEAHKYSTRVIAHVFYLEDARALVAAGVDGFAHLPRDAEVDEALAAEMRKRDVFVLPNLSVSHNGTLTAPPAWMDDPLFRSLVAPDIAARMRAAYGKRTAAAAERARTTYAGMQRSLARLNAAGVRIGFGTDAGAVPDHPHAFTDHRELELMVQAGLTPAQALAAATINSATILELDTRFGSIDVGKSADLVVLDANPLEAITNTRRISRVYLRGAEVNRAALARQWTATNGGQP
jgi:imidazolonepropionase-like amidohydrolase